MSNFKILFLFLFITGSAFGEIKPLKKVILYSKVMDEVSKVEFDNKVGKLTIHHKWGTWSKNYEEIMLDYTGDKEQLQILQKHFRLHLPKLDNELIELWNINRKREIRINRKISAEQDLDIKKAKEKKRRKAAALARQKRKQKALKEEEGYGVVVRGYRVKNHGVKYTGRSSSQFVDAAWKVTAWNVSATRGALLHIQFQDKDGFVVDSTVENIDHARGMKKDYTGSTMIRRSRLKEITSVYAFFKP